MTRQFGLIGYPLTHSFSPDYFSKKFEKENIDATYELYPLERIELLPGLLQNHPSLEGLNVTIPFKESVIGYADDISKEAHETGAVNTLKITGKPQTMRLKGFNTDIYGFRESLKHFLAGRHNIKALILGSGGASAAVAWVLKQSGIVYHIVSRSPKSGMYAYEDLNKEIIHGHHLIINTTPLGMPPATDKKPPIPYQHLTHKNLCYDLIYNPPKTSFLASAEKKGAAIKNGLEMLQLQAEKSWEIWDEKLNP
ncbi:MAG: shikimate dehydrogenase [Bacteroidales bacterium]|nr:shikimate dehydrogenase [Bacteroidales bacterium]MCF8337336.1 shikimate dehydrogenase [Bacteroidales bacterium]